jgi:5-methylcytosine-specific restriction endonuclease McrA
VKAESALADFWAWLDGNRIPQQREPEPDPEPLNYIGAITGSGKRTRPKAAIKKEILAKQKGRCLYCDHLIGAIVRRRKDNVVLRINWDHFVPYAYGHTNAGTNWVAACHVCNNIKHCRMFDTVRDAKAFILARWADKGYEIRSALARAEGR